MLSLIQPRTRLRAFTVVLLLSCLYVTRNKTKWIWIYDREKRRYKATILQKIKPYKATRHHTRLKNILQGHARPYKAIQGHTRQFNTIILFQEHFLFHCEHFLFVSEWFPANKNNKKKASFRTFELCSLSKILPEQRAIET